MYNKLNEILNELGQDYTQILIKILKEESKIASKSLINSIKWEVKDGELIISANDYLINVDSGRKPNGKLPPLKSIKEWTKIKGIPTSAAFPIAKSIAKKGIKPTNIISKSFSKFNDKYFDKYGDAAKEIILDKINKLK